VKRSSAGSKILHGSLITLLLLSAAGAFIRWHGVSSTPAQWWYPFIPALFSDHYTAGPFAMTSNTREDNPVWSQIAGFNRTQARLSYAATRGEPRAQIAWLLADAEWKDQPVFPSRALRPNKLESGTSKALTAAAVEYDRISRRDLGQATAEGATLVVGQARYDALLVSELHVATPELLQNLVTLATQGVPIVWLGDFPARAAGWAQHEQRDAAVRSHVERLRGLVAHCASDAGLLGGCGNLRQRAALAPADGSAMALRMHRRVLGNEQFLLLFNESDRPVVNRYVADNRFRVADLLNPETGDIQSLDVVPTATAIELDIAVPARRTRVLHLQTGAERGGGDAPAPAATWKVDAWQSPPRAMHPFVRWWWPGNAVDQDELRRELNSLHAAGFGGVELQTLTLGFTFDALRKGRDSIYQVGTPAYFDNLLVVFREAERLGMTVDLTMGSGWSSGGPFIERSPSQQLIKASLDASGPASIDVPLPVAQEPWYAARTNGVIPNTIGTFDPDTRLQRLVAAKVDSSTEPATLSELRDISEHVSGGRIRWEVPAGSHRIFALYQNASSHNAAGSAYPGALERSPILDHLDRGGVEEYIEKLGEPWLHALAPFKPDAFFVDSFELIAELPWSAGFARRFEQMHGYDISPSLPLVFRRSGESRYLDSLAPQGPAYRSADERGERVREDYLATREQLFREMFLQPLKEWTAAKGVKLRLQAHGGYGDCLDGYQLADIPEAEGLFGGGSFDFLKLASSAAHVAGRPVVASESFIKLALDFDALDIEDYHLLAGNAFAAGINRTVCHGYAYHYPLQP
jgi:hypothetical protein